MLLSDIAEEYGLTKLAALDACALGGLRIRSFHTELTDSQVERLRWVLGPTSPHGSPAAPVEAPASSLLNRWDEATGAGGSTTTVVAPIVEEEYDEGDDDALDPAHLAALALVEAEEETIDAAALAAELRRLANEPEVQPEPPVEPEVRATEPEVRAAAPELIATETSSVDPFPAANDLSPVEEPAAPTSRELPSRHPFKPLSFEDVVADIAVQLQEEDKQTKAQSVAPVDDPVSTPDIAPAFEEPPATPMPPPPLAPAAPAPAAAPLAPSPQPAGRSHVAPPTGGTRPRDLDVGGDAADAGALAFLDHRNVIEATPIPEERPLEKKVIGSLVMGLWVAILVGAVVLIVQFRGGSDDTESAGSDANGDNTVGAVRDVFDLSEGDCFTTPGIGSVQTAVVVPCVEPHTAEVYATVEYPTTDGSFPGDQALSSFADQACLEAFPGFIGVDYLVSGLDYYFVTPQQSAWDDGGRRTVSCSVIEPGFRPVTGTLEGSAR